jgi:hypothetical membrane protein
LTPDSAPREARPRWQALGGVIGPVGFVGAWSLSGLAANHYSAIEDAISRLAEIGAPTRVAMTAGFVVFGIALPVYSGALHAALDGPAWITALATGVATLAVAAAPLDSHGHSTVHGVFATIGYVTLAATPLLASRAFARAGRIAWARWSVAAGVASGACLIATVAGPAHGLFQRLGLGVVDAWIVATAIEIIRTGRLAAEAGSPSHDPLIFGSVRCGRRDEW